MISRTKGFPSASLRSNLFLPFSSGKATLTRVIPFMSATKRQVSPLYHSPPCFLNSGKASLPFLSINVAARSTIALISFACCDCGSGVAAKADRQITNAPTAVRIDVCSPAMLIVSSFGAVLLFFLRRVRGIDVVKLPWPRGVDLKHRLFLRPGEVVHLRRHDPETAGRQRRSLVFVELVAKAEVERAGEDRHVLGGGMPVRGYVVIGGELDAKSNRPFSVQRPFEHRDLRARRHRRHVGPF